MQFNINNITEIRVHRNPHLDEVLAAMLVLLVSGRDIKVTIVDPDHDRGGNNPRIMRIGYGGGMFDEHPLKDKHQNVTAAYLVAETLGVLNSFTGVLEDAARIDRTATASTTSVASILKTLHGEIGEEKALNWALDGASALLVWYASNAKLPDAALRQTLVEEVSTEVWSSFIEEHKGQAELGNTVKRTWDECKKARTMSGLWDIGVVASMMPLSKAKAWLSVAIKGFFARQIAFEEAVTVVSKAERFSVPCVNEVKGVLKRGGYTVVVVHSDNRQVNQAYRSNRITKQCGSAQILIQIGRCGVQVQTDHKAEINLDNFVALLRLAECRKHGSNLHINSLFGEGCVEGVPEWHYFPEGRMVLNGSHSHPNVPRTFLSPQEIVTVLNYSFQGEPVCWEFVKNTSIIKRRERIGSRLQNRIPV